MTEGFSDVGSDPFYGQPVLPHCTAARGNDSQCAQSGRSLEGNRVDALPSDTVGLLSLQPPALQKGRVAPPDVAFSTLCSRSMPAPKARRATAGCRAEARAQTSL